MNYFKEKHNKKNLYLVSEIEIRMPDEVVDNKKDADIGGRPDFVICDIATIR